MQNPIALSLRVSLTHTISHTIAMYVLATMTAQAAVPGPTHHVQTHIERHYKQNGILGGGTVGNIVGDYRRQYHHFSGECFPRCMMDLLSDDTMNGDGVPSGGSEGGLDLMEISGASEDRPAEYQVDSNDESSYNPPDYVTELTEASPHVSDILRGVNAMYDFTKKKADAAKQEESRAAQALKQKRIEDEHALAEEETPSSHFSLSHSNVAFDDDNLILKGRVLRPKVDSRERVDAIAIYLEEDATHALLVLKLSDKSLCPALCRSDLLPRITISTLVAKDANASKRRAWSPIYTDAIGVKREERQLFFLKNGGPFGRRTCNKEMLRLLQSDLVAECKGQKRTVYGALPVAFDRGRVLEASEVYDIILLDGAMYLGHPQRSSDVPRRIFDCAMNAKNSLRTERDSAVKILDIMEMQSVAATDAERSMYNQYLNVALGGLPRFDPYGSARFVPCAVLAAKHAYPNGSFRSYKCCCDINVSECNDPDAKKKMAKLLKGHNPTRLLKKNKDK